MTTLQELKEYPREMLTACMIAPIIGCDPMLIRVTAREAPEALGFPVLVMGSRVKIPKAAFIKFMEGRA